MKITTLHTLIKNNENCVNNKEMYNAYLHSIKENERLKNVHCFGHQMTPNTPDSGNEPFLIEFSGKLW